MSVSLARHKCRYHAAPEVIREYVESHGYETEDIRLEHMDGPAGFRVRGTTVEISFDLYRNGHVWGFGMITLNNYRSLGNAAADEARAASSLKLYRQLYRRFRKPRPTDGTADPTTRRSLGVERAFRLSVSPEHLQDFLHQRGYHTAPILLWLQPIGFRVCDTNVRVAYRQRVGRAEIPGAVGLDNDYPGVANEVDKAVRSAVLFEELRSTFGGAK